MIAHKLEESYDLAALSLVSRRCLKAANHAMRKLDVRSIPRDLQDEFLERLLNRFDNLRTLVWGRERVIEVNEWTRAYSFDPMARDSEEEEKIAQQAAFIAAKAPHLSHLAVESPSIVLTPQALQALLSAMPRLMTLVLTGAFWSPVSQSKALAIVGGACPLLESFAFRDYSGSTALDSSKSEDLAAAKRFAEGCPRVRSLTLGEVNEVALTLTVELLKLCTGLQELSLHPYVPEPQGPLLLQTVGQTCRGLTHLELHLDNWPTLDEILSELLSTATWPQLKVLRVFSNEPQQWEPVILAADIWRDFQARHPLIEECVVPCLGLLETLLPYDEGQLLWGRLRKVDPGLMYTDERTDFGTH